MGAPNTIPSLPPLPRRVILSLQIGGAFFAAANVVCVAILAYTYLASKNEPRTLEVKGSAKKEIVSDRIAWSGTFTASDPDLVKAYSLLNSDANRVALFLRKEGIPDEQVTFSSVSTNKVYQQQVIPKLDDDGKMVPQIVQTPKVEMYELSQSVDIESSDMDKVPAVSRSITSLIKDGVEIDSGAPRYLYSKLSELKIDMLGEATRDATLRAEQIVSNANGALGRLLAAKMGVMQINPKGVTDVSDTGNNDTTSLDKDVLAVVTVEFELK
jgi:uncharacterized protein